MVRRVAIGWCLFLTVSAQMEMESVGRLDQIRITFPESGLSPGPAQLLRVPLATDVGIGKMCVSPESTTALIAVT